MRVLAIGLALLATPALAQDGSLTTLMRPQPLGGRTAPLAGRDRLFGDNPLANVDSLAGEGSLSNPRPARARADPANPAKPGEDAAACDPRTTSGRATVPGAASGGSGPGEYARFVDSGRTAPIKPPARAGEQPLYGGVDQPLWGDPRPSVVVGRTAAAPAREPSAAPRPGTDRPLWGGAGATSEAAACEPEPGTPRAGVVAPPSPTLFFGAGPNR